MPARNELVIRGNAVGLTASNYPNDSKFEQKILYLEKNGTTYTETLGTGTLTQSGAATNGDKILIGNRTYTYVTALTGAQDEIKLTGAAATELDMLKDAVNATAVTGAEGTDFFIGGKAHEQVTATTNGATTQVVAARNSAFDNASVALTDPVDGGSVFSWGAATLASGVRGVTAVNTSASGGSAGISGDKNL